MLNLDKLLVKILKAVGAEPIITDNGSISKATYRPGSRVSVGYFTNNNILWTVTALGTENSSNAQYYLVETYGCFNIDFTNHIPSDPTSGDYYTSRFDLTEDDHSSHPRFWKIATASLNDLVSVGGTDTLISRVGFGSATLVTNTGTSSHMCSQLAISSSDLNNFKYRAFRVGKNVTSNLITFSYVISLWRVDNPDYLI